MGLRTLPWRQIQLGDALTLQRGFDLPHRQRRAGSVPIVSSSGISGFHDRAPVAGPGVITGRYGTIGEVFYINEDFWPLNTTLYVRNFKKNDPLYLSYLLRTIDFQSHSGKSGVPGVNRNDLHQLNVTLPCYDEQRSIAAALSDADRLIGALDRLIAKKRAIKLGAMQQLLTGRTRLPGFAGEWETNRLGDVSSIKTGKKNNEDKVEDGLYPFFVRSQIVERINSFSYDGEAILVPGEGGIGSIYHYINGRFDYHQRVYKISDFSNEFNGRFIYYSMLLTFNEEAMRNSVKATVDSLRLPTFLGFQFVAPSAVEQAAIATVLSDTDAEIAALERRRDKTKAIKQGMMQVLLTGRVRLVSPAMAEGSGI